MNTFNSIVIGFIQGITEFLPISSSGHMVVLSDVFNLTTETFIGQNVQGGGNAAVGAVPFNGGTGAAVATWFRVVTFTFLLYLFKNILGNYVLSRMLWKIRGNTDKL